MFFNISTLLAIWWGWADTQLYFVNLSPAPLFLVFCDLAYKCRSESSEQKHDANGMIKFLNCQNYESLDTTFVKMS